jgi:lysophospholipase L1-like esterase
LVALSLVSAALPLLAAEVVLRLMPEPNSYVSRDGREKPRFNTYVSSGLLAYELRSNWTSVHDSAEFEVTVRTNALGLRGRASSPKDEGTYRMLMLGDSFIFGFGVEDDETLPAQLEATLGTRHEGIEVLNAGVPGWSTDQYYLFLRTRLDEITPDLVMLGLLVNDPDDGNMRYVNNHRFGLPSLKFPARVWFQDHSQLYHWVRYRLTRAWVALSIKAKAQAWDANSGDGPSGPIEALPDDEIQEGLETSASFRLRYHRFLVDSIERLCEDHEVDLRIVQLATRSLPKPGTTGSALREDCAARGDRCLDLTSFLPEEVIDTLYFPVDGHPNPEGHRWAAGVIADWLTRDPHLGLAIRPRRR